MNCPHCKEVMQQESIRERHTNLKIDRCPSCDGIWLGQMEMQKLESIVEPVFWEVRKIASDVDQLKGLHCPSCDDQVLMVKADHDRDANVVVDYCPNCRGAWLDKGELRAIQQENIFLAVYQLMRDL